MEKMGKKTQVIDNMHLITFLVNNVIQKSLSVILFQLIKNAVLSTIVLCYRTLCMLNFKLPFKPIHVKKSMLIIDSPDVHHFKFDRIKR